jgi:hypothetical protein
MTAWTERSEEEGNREFQTEFVKHTLQLSRFSSILVRDFNAGIYFTIL